MITTPQLRIFKELQVKNSIIFLIIAGLFVSYPSYSDTNCTSQKDCIEEKGDTIVFGGLPISRIYNNSKETLRYNFSDVDKPNQERRENAVMITKRDGKYYWGSRKGIELIHRKDGAYHQFIDPITGSYVKIANFRDAVVFNNAFKSLGEDKSDDLGLAQIDGVVWTENRGPKYLYMEHVHMLLYTITYWGVGELYDE